MTTLISFLGKGQNSQGYRLANYLFEDKSTFVEQKYLGLTLTEKLKPSRLILLGTAGSMWDVFLESESSQLESQWLDLSESVQKEQVTTEQLQPFESFLSKKLGLTVQCILIPFARTEQDQIGVLSSLAEHLVADEKVVMDVTHGFRHLPMLALVAARFLQKINKIQVEQIYYGALDMTENDRTPVLELGSLLNMLDWIDALSTFDKDGDYGVFSLLLAEQGLSIANADMLKQAAFFERTSNSSNARQKLQTIFTSIEKLETPLFGLFKQQLLKRLRWFRLQGRGRQEQQLAWDFLERRDYLRAVIYGMEGMISDALSKKKKDENDFDQRKIEIDLMSENNDSFRRLKLLRNSLAHGVRPKNSHNDILNALSEESRMQQSLKSRFDHLLD